MTENWNTTPLFNWLQAPFIELLIASENKYQSTNNANLIQSEEPETNVMVTVAPTAVDNFAGSVISDKIELQTESPFDSWNVRVYENFN